MTPTPQAASTPSLPPRQPPPARRAPPLRAVPVGGGFCRIVDERTAPRPDPAR